MRLSRFFIIAIMVFSTGAGCIKQVNVDTRLEKPILVVEGGITIDSTPYTVKLSYSGPLKFGNYLPDYLESDATVSISDDEGKSTPLTLVNAGVYQTTDSSYVGQAGRSYSISITLKDGRKYISVPEKIAPAVPFDSVHVRFINDHNLDHPAYMAVYVSAQDPAAQENYYRWAFYSWMPRQTKGVGCGFGCRFGEYCFQKYTEDSINVLSDNDINGNRIENRYIGRSYIYAFGKHYIDAAQLSISREFYQFLDGYQQQLSRSGSIFDPLPASIKGNVYNAADSTEFALGYFSATGAYHHRYVVVPYSITRFLLDVSAISFIPPEDVVCFEYFPNTLSYPYPPAVQDPPPPGWENADTIKVYW